MKAKCDFTYASVVVKKGEDVLTKGFDSEELRSIAYRGFVETEEVEVPVKKLTAAEKKAAAKLEVVEVAEEAEGENL